MHTSYDPASFFQSRGQSCILHCRNPDIRRAALLATCRVSGFRISCSYGIKALSLNPKRLLQSPVQSLQERLVGVTLSAWYNYYIGSWDMPGFGKVWQVSGCFLSPLSSSSSSSNSSSSSRRRSSSNSSSSSSSGSSSSCSSSYYSSSCSSSCEVVVIKEHSGPGHGCGRSRKF